MPGFLYRTSRYAELFAGIASTKAEHVIIDTHVLVGVEGPLVQVRAERTAHEAKALRDRYAMGKQVISAVPSEEAVVVMLETAGYEVDHRTDWERISRTGPVLPTWSSTAGDDA